MNFKNYIILFIAVFMASIYSVAQTQRFVKDFEAGYVEIETLSSNVVEGILDYCEDFDALTVGGLVADQLGDPWIVLGWDDDAIVSDTYAHSGNNSFIVDEAVSLFLELANEPITEGQHLYSNYMYVLSGFSGYFNVQTNPTPGIGWAIEIFLNDDGNAYAKENSIQYDFTYNMDAWTLVEINFDLDNGLAQVLIDGSEIVQWVMPVPSIGSINYYGADVEGAPMCYFDDVCFAEGWHITTVEKISEHGIFMFPNPASEFVSLQSDFVIKDVKIYNYDGQMVRDENVNSKFYQVITSELYQGIYFFQIYTVNGVISKRIVIK